MTISQIKVGNATHDITLPGLTASVAELNYVDGVTSNVQTQLNAKLDKSGGTMTGEIKIGQGDGYGIQLGTDGRINATTSEGSNTATVCGLSGTNYLCGHSSFNTTMRGKASRPTYNGSNIALQSDILPTNHASTETTYGVGSTSNYGHLKVGNNISVSSGTISLSKANVTAALGYTPPTINTTYNEATTSAAGLMSAADKTKLNSLDPSAYVNSVVFTVTGEDAVLSVSGGALSVNEVTF